MSFLASNALSKLLRTKEEIQEEGLSRQVEGPELPLLPSSEEQWAPLRLHETAQAPDPEFDLEGDDRDAGFPSDEEGLVPPPPLTLEDTGLSMDLIVGLLVKILHQRGSLTGFGISDALALPFGLIDDLLMELQKGGVLEVKETGGPARSSYRFALTGKGKEKAWEELAASRYVGPAPVPFEQYVDWVLQQSVETVRIRKSQLESGLSDLVLPEGFLDLLGPAVNSGKSLFLYGDPGNGKTRIAEGVASLFGESFFVPHAVDLSGHIMVLFDPVFHEALEPIGEDPSAGLSIFRKLRTHDQRFVRVKRPVAVAGAELEMSQLDLRYDPFSRTYQAPIQLKANGGVLVIDDLGRQRVRPRDLLNRWIVPLEHRMDYLSLESGKKLAVPFDCLVVFSTNIQPEDLVEEAFLRRIHYKIRVEDPTPEQYDQIFARCCEEHGIEFDPEAPELVRKEFYRSGKSVPRGCHPRDILAHVRDIAIFRGVDPSLTPELLMKACESYFVAMKPRRSQNAPEGREEIH